MTTATYHHSTALPEVRSEPRKGLFSRILEALIEARMRQATRELAMYRHLVPADVLKSAGYEATVTKDAALPFTR